MATNKAYPVDPSANDMNAITDPFAGSDIDLGAVMAAVGILPAGGEGALTPLPVLENLDNDLQVSGYWEQPSPGSSSTTSSSDSLTPVSGGINDCFQAIEGGLQVINGDKGLHDPQVVNIQPLSSYNSQQQETAVGALQLSQQQYVGYVAYADRMYGNQPIQGANTSGYSNIAYSLPTPNGQQYRQMHQQKAIPANYQQQAIAPMPSTATALPQHSNTKRPLPYDDVQQSYRACKKARASPTLTAVPAMPTIASMTSAIPPAVPAVVKRSQTAKPRQRKSRSAAGSTQPQQKTSVDKENRPSPTYVEMIGRALMSAPDQRLLLIDIYAYILQNYPYYRTAASTWKNAVRYTLTANDFFIKDGRSKGPNSGFFWRVHRACVDMFAKGDFRRMQANRLAQQAEKDNTATDTAAVTSDDGTTYQQMTTTTMPASSTGDSLVATTSSIYSHIIRAANAGYDKVPSPAAAVVAMPSKPYSTATSQIYLNSSNGYSQASNTHHCYNNAEYQTNDGSFSNASHYGNDCCVVRSAYQSIPNYTAYPSNDRSMSLFEL